MNKVLVKPKKIIFDIDIGVDDAMALITAFYHPGIDIKLITVVFGNVSLKQATKNACYVTQMVGDKDYPIFYGAEKGLRTDGNFALDVHGKTGLGTTIVAKNVTKKTGNKKDYGALEAMRDVILQNPNEITIVSVGPLTNTAQLLMKYPEVKDKLEGIAMEVGSIDGKGSITPYSSFNAYCDPEAVDIVIKSGVPISLTTKEVGTTAFFDENQRSKFRTCGRVGEFIYHLCSGYKDKLLQPGQYAVHDTCVLLSLLENDVFTRENVDMEINISDDVKRGQTKFHSNPNSHISLVTSVNKHKLFKKMEEIYSLS